MSKLKVFPVDLLGTAPSNKVTGEVRTIEQIGDRIFIPTGGPFYTKSLKVWANGVPLTNGTDYRAKELNRNATIDSGKEVCNAIHLIKPSATTFLLEYQVIGGEYAELGEELADFIAGTPLNDLTKIHWNNILYKPETYPPSPHSHTAAEWRGYGEAVYLVDQFTTGLTNGRTAIFDALKEEVKRHVELGVEEWIDEHGLIVTDDTPTVNGNVLLVGDGTSPTPLHFDYEALFDELDARYFRNVINPLTRIGAVSDSFLPITSGFFNVAVPYLTTRHTMAVGKVERNGDLLVLTPASDGEMIRYVYGYVREWSRVKSIAGFKATNQQYKPAGLGADEEIMELMGINNQTMIASIYTVGSDGKATFKEHAIVELNDTLLQEGHTLIRLGNEILNKIGTTNPNAVRQWRPSFCRMRDGSYYMVAFYATASPGSIKVLSLSSSKILTLMTDWSCVKETRNVTHRDGLPDLVNSTARVTIPNLATDHIRPYEFYKSAAGAGELWIVDNTQPLSNGDSINNNNYDNDLVTHVKGDEIFVMGTMMNRVYFNNINGWFASRDANAGYSYRLRVKNATPELAWLRTKSSAEESSSYLVNADTGYIEHDPVAANCKFVVPYDMAGGMQDLSAWWDPCQIHLADGHMLIWRPPSPVGNTASILQARLSVEVTDPVELMNGYNYNRMFRLAGSGQNTIDIAKINLENPTPIPLGVACYPMNDGRSLMLFGSATYGGGPQTCSQYIYKPSTKLVNYKTMDMGLVQGYDTSDDRKLLASNAPPPFMVSSRDSAGTCRYSTMVLKSNSAFFEQTIHRKVTLNYDSPSLVLEQPYVMKQRGYDQIEFAINSVMGVARFQTGTSWYVYISPEDPTVALFDCMAAHANRTTFTRFLCAAKLTWDANNELIGFVIRPEAGQVSTGNLPLVTGVLAWQSRAFFGAWAIQYNAAKTEAHWHGRSSTALAWSGNINNNTAIHSLKMTKASDGFPILTLYRSSGGMDGRKLVVTTPRGVGVMTDDAAFGVFRVFRPFLNFNWVSGEAWSTNSADAFVWYSPRPTVSFKLRVTEDINVQLGGVYSTISAGVYELTDPIYSTVTDPKNKTIKIYATLLRGKATLQFSEEALPESIYTTYIGKCVTDTYGVTQADILPVNRIGHYRPSASPQGSAFSASSNTADKEQLLNWDADIPTNLISTRVTGRIVGADKVQQYATAQYTMELTPSTTAVSTKVWQSLNPAIGTINQSGVFTGVAEGSVVIRCTVNDEVVAQKTLTVEETGIGIDMAQFTGKTTFDTTASYVKVVQDGKFFVKDKARAVALFNGFTAVKTSGGVNGAQGYLNGHNIWKGKGTSWNRWDATPYIVEGWNTVHMEWGELWIEARLFDSRN